MKNSHINFIYKYQKIDDHSLENLKNCAIWFSKPIMLDDPFDCEINMDCPKIDYYLINQLKEYWLTNGFPLHPRYIQFLIESNVEQLEEFIRARIIEGMERARAREYNESGIACFSERKDDLLMWSLYSDKHGGFCLEFDTNYSPFYKIQPVNYTSKIPCIDFPPTIDLLMNKFWEDAESLKKLVRTVMPMLLTKAKCWNYQKEWRILRDSGDGLEVIDDRCITSIYFGVKMTDEDQRKIRNIIKGRNMRCFKMKKNKRAFKLDWIEVI